MIDLECIRNFFKKYKDVKAIVISGSVARGKREPNDLDILLITSGPVSIDFKELERLVGLKVDAYICHEEVAKSQLLLYLRYGSIAIQGVVNAWCLHAVLKAINEDLARKFIQEIKDRVPIQHESIIIHGEEYLKRLAYLIINYCAIYSLFFIF